MTPDERELEPGDVVQLGPMVNSPMFSHCFMTVTEPKHFGAQGYVQMTGEHGKPGGQAYFRAKWEDMTYIGKAEWVVM